MRVWSGLWLALFFLVPAAWADFLPWGRADERALLAGRAALEDGMYDVARQNFEAYIDETRNKKKKARATLLLAESLHALGQCDKAVRLLDDRLQWARRADIEVDFLYWKANCFRSMGEPGRALSILDHARTLGAESPATPVVMQLAAAISLETGNFEDAANRLAVLLDTYPDREDAPDMALERAKVFIGCERLDDALEVLSALQEQHPGAVAANEGRLLVGKLFRRMENVVEAQAVLVPLATNLQVEADLRAESWFELAEMERNLSQFANADQSLQQGILLATDIGTKARGMADRGRVLVLLGREEEGFALMRNSVLSQPNPATAAATQIEFAELLQQQGKNEQAVQEFQVFMEAFSGQGLDARALWGKAWCLWGLDRFPEAATAFEDVFELDTDPEMRAEALMKAADSHFAEGQFGAATEAYRRFSREFPEHDLVGQARFQEAESHVRVGAFDRAIELLEMVGAGAAELPHAKMAAYRRALVLERAGRHEEALAAYSGILEAGEKGEAPLDAIHRRGFVHLALNNDEAALDDFTRVAELMEPGLIREEALVKRGHALYMLGREAEALGVWRGFIEAHPDSPLTPSIRFRLGQYLWNVADFVKAEDQFLALFKTDPESELAEQALFLAARAARKQQKYTEALDHIKVLIRTYEKSDRMPEARLLQGEVLRDMGKFSGAIVLFEQITKNWPESHLVDSAWGLIGDCQRTLGTGTNGTVRAARFRAARDSFRMVIESPTATPELRLQAKYKMGVVLENQELWDEALDAYKDVVYAFLGDWGTNHRWGALYFTEAAFRAVGILEKRGEYSLATNILQRVVEARIPAAEQAENRIRKILEQELRH